MRYGSTEYVSSGRHVKVLVMDSNVWCGGSATGSSVHQANHSGYTSQGLRMQYSNAKIFEHSYVKLRYAIDMYKDDP